jgi:RNA polymerase sigma-70 factor, ECF subfamily
VVDSTKASTPVPSAQVAVPRDDIADSYARLRVGLLGYLRGRVEDAATAEDLLRTVFLKALKTDQTVKSSGAIASWFYTIARNTVIDHYRARRLAGELTDDVMFEEEDASSLQALSLCLLPMAQQLSPLYRDVVLATEFQGKTKQTAASELGSL